MNRFLFRWVLVPVLVGVLAFVVRCGIWAWRAGQSSGTTSAAPERPIDEAHRAFATAFGESVVKKDWKGLAAMCSPVMRRWATPARLSEEFGHYVGAVSVKVVPEEAGLDDFLPREIRRSEIKERVAILFDATEGDGFSCHLWIVEVNGAPKAAHLFLSD
jgi:hypothetical protein